MMGFRSDILRMRDKKAALAHVERVGKGVRVLIDTADPSRVERAEGITDRVNPIRDSLSEVAATVAGSNPNDGYMVVIRFGHVARSACECPDFGRTGPCKHVIAVAESWLEQVARPTWRELKRG
jgi:uncharacterized Zn finger protein